MLEQETVGQEATIILGKNIGIGWHREEIREQKYHLSDHSRINLLAAGIDYTRGRTDKIIFSTGKPISFAIMRAVSLERIKGEEYIADILRHQ